MRVQPSLPMVLATVLLHALLIALAASGILNADRPHSRPEPLTVSLIEPAAVKPPSRVPSAPSSPPVAPPQSVQIPPEPTPKAANRKTMPETKPKPKASPPTAAASAPPEAAPPAPQATRAPDLAPAPEAGPPAAIPSQSPPGPPAPVATPLARTGVSIASYAATNRKPPYPRLSRNSGEQGTVVLRVLITTDGTVGGLELASSSGYPLLDEAARSTVRHWRFHPATVDGRPVAEWYQVPIPFTLHEP